MDEGNRSSANAKFAANRCALSSKTDNKILIKRFGIGLFAKLFLICVRWTMVNTSCSLLYGAGSQGARAILWFVAECYSRWPMNRRLRPVDKRKEHCSQEKTRAYVRN